MNVQELPDGYELIETLNLQQDNKEAMRVNVLALILAVLCYFVGRTKMSIGEFFVLAGSLGTGLLRLFLALAGVVAYMFLHEWVHGIFIRLFGKVKPKYGFDGIYAYAGTDQAWFDRRSYLVIALAPVVVWGIVLAALAYIVPDGWFWTIFFVQLVNISGAAGDFYVTWKMFHMPADVLVQDTGTAMEFFGKA